MNEPSGPPYLFRFGFETAKQSGANEQQGWDDENSQCLFIVAADEEEALKWGNHIAERFVQ